MERDIFYNDFFLILNFISTLEIKCSFISDFKLSTETQQVVKMTNLLYFIHRLFLIKTRDVSETGVCLRLLIFHVYVLSFSYIYSMTWPPLLSGDRV
jgi:hypothetical protein